jgi:DNA-binding transcriptional MerR regulator
MYNIILKIKRKKIVDMSIEEIRKFMQRALESTKNKYDHLEEKLKSDTIDDEYIWDLYKVSKTSALKIFDKLREQGDEHLQEAIRSRMVVSEEYNTYPKTFDGYISAITTLSRISKTR